MLVFFFRQFFATINFQYPFKPKGIGTFSTHVLNFYGRTFRLNYVLLLPLLNSTKWTDLTKDQYSCPQSGRTPRGLIVWQKQQSGRTPRGIKIHVHKVDGPHEGSTFTSIKWTNPTRVNCLTKFTKWTDPTRDQDSCPQSGRTPRELIV